MYLEVQKHGMNWILFIALLICVYYLFSRRNYLQKLKKYRSTLLVIWGKPKETSYFDFRSIERYYTNAIVKQESVQQLTDQNCKDLDIDELFKYIDRTHSKIGQQYLYYRLRTLQKRNDTIQEELAAHFQLEEATRVEVQMLLSRLSGEYGYYFETLFNEQAVQKPRFINWIYALSIFSALITLTAFIYPLVLVLLIPILIINLFFHYRNKRMIYDHSKAIREFNVTFKVAKELAKKTKIKELFNDFSYLKRLNIIERKASIFRFDAKLENEWLLLLWLPIEYLKISFNLEYIIFYSLINSFLKQRENLEQLFIFIGKVELSLTVASLKSEGRVYCTPDFSKEKRINVTGIYHPLLKNSVSNSLDLDGESLLLTGSNMSGKTTFVRTIGINSVLAQSLGICYASSYVAPFFKIYSSIRITDNLLEDTSYYLKEVLVLKEFVDLYNSAESCLFMLDEIFKGTNTQERISGGYAILDYLNQRNHVVLVATHDLELVDLLKSKKYATYYFQEEIVLDELKFDYKIRKGKMTKQNAIRILELNDYPKVITDTAYRIKETIFDGL